MDINKILEKEFNLASSQVENTIELIDQGNTIPFIARYRKEKTGAMEDVVLRDFYERLNYLRSLEEKRQEVTRLISDQDKLDDDLVKLIKGAKTLKDLDDIYRPFRPKRRTRATIAKEKGLLGLANLITEGGPGDLYDLADGYLNEEVPTREEALAGARDIIAEDISDDLGYRQALRDFVWKNGLLVSEKLEDNKVYEMYYDYKEGLGRVANHRVLAMNRGEAEKVLRISIDFDNKSPLDYLKERIGKDLEDSYYSQYLLALEDSYKRLLFPSIEREIRTSLRERAEEEAIGVFSNNLKHLLLQAPLKDKVALAIDPGFRTGCKIAVVDERASLLAYDTIYPTPPRNERKKSMDIIEGLVRDHGVEIIAIGNGTASRETENLVSDLIGERKLNVSYTIVSEAGASVYSASELASREFPELDVSIRGAISIARRLQDPLAELVKIEPKHIGVGQYQHDLNQKKLEESLKDVVEDCVNSVGVDLNTASPSLLSYVAGISPRLAENITEAREDQGGFKRRKDLLKVKGLGPKTYTQCAGFLRIAQGEDILDNTGVHPESYDVARALINMDYKSKKLEDLSRDLDIGILSLKDIISELEKPGRDPREDMPGVVLRQDVLDIKDLEEAMVLKGTVRNVVDFGAFVDIGVGVDGLVHVSQLSNKFVKNPMDFVQIGDIVNVRILEIDHERSRISLSMKDI